MPTVDFDAPETVTEEPVRFIGMDSNTGYIFFDTADLVDWMSSGSDEPVEAVRIYEEFENVRGGNDVEYIEHSRAPQGASGYHIYRYNYDPADRLAAVSDGTDQEMIEAVERLCDYVGFVEVRTLEG